MITPMTSPNSNNITSSGSNAQVSCKGGNLEQNTLEAELYESTGPTERAEPSESTVPPTLTATTEPTESPATTEPTASSAKILVMHASVGSGHRAAAEAIAYALRKKIASGEKLTPTQPSNIEVEVLDSLDFARFPIDGNKTASGFVGPTRPLYDVFWRYFFTGRILWHGGQQWLRVMFPRFASWVRENKPVAIVCTHITAANIAVGARRKLKMNFPILCVPTDYEVEGQWPHIYTDLFCAANRYMAETLRARRIPDERVLVTGIPVNPCFSQPHDRAKARKKWGFDDNTKVALVLAGAKLPKPYLRLRETLDKLFAHLDNFPHMKFVFVAGNDEEYALSIKKNAQLQGIDNVEVLGYVDNMPELMSACDFTICKAGGLTVTECLCARNPMVLVGKAYGQEKANVRMLTSRGAALHVQTWRELLETIYYIDKDETMLDSLLRNVEMVRQPNAANDIAKATLEMAYSPVTDEESKRRIKYHFLIGIGDKPAHTR